MIFGIHQSNHTAAFGVDNLKLVLVNDDNNDGWVEPPENVVNEPDIGVECGEFDINYAGFGIPDNKIENILSASDCQVQCQVSVLHMTIF